MLKTALLLALACASSASVAQFADARDIDYPLNGVVLGNGWSSLSASKTAGACVGWLGRAALPPEISSAARCFGVTDARFRM
jgi:hypothetical protein